VFSSPTDSTDESLVAAYLERGDERAFRRLVERHQSRIYGYLVGMVQDRDTANDLFQETFARALDAMHQRRGGYADQGRWIHWIMRIARNATLDHLRAKKRWQMADTGDGEEEPLWERLPDEAPGAEALLEQSNRQRWLESLIARLPADQREVLLLRHDSDLTFREIAALTDCSINTALGRMRYALLNLRRMIDHTKQRPLRDISATI
jgi:RNA polymerase sigma-70 factor (ECF subfamily)